MSDGGRSERDLSPAEGGGSCARGTCGCCEGTRVRTPAEITNRPGLSAIAYRVGTHAQFKRSMLARLSDSARPALLDLRTRDDDDFTVALLDAWAVVADVLTFYQERVANESYLRTATERLSVVELARLLGYEPAPGVAAGTWLAFTVESAAGSPGRATVPKGAQVKSVPGQDEKPQTFETVEEIEARAEWNALRPRLTAPRRPSAGDAHVYLKGTATDLKIGDALLFTGYGRDGKAGGERWDFRRVRTVTPDFEAGRTLVTWEPGLGSVSPRTAPAAEARVYALRLRAGVFGHNAPDWRTLHDSVKAGYIRPGRPEALTDAQRAEWPDFNIFTPGAAASDPAPPVDLDAVYPQVRPGGRVVLATPGWVELYKVESAAEAARAGFGLTGKTTRVKLEGENLREKFTNEVRSTAVFAHDEELALAETPLAEPVWGDRIELDGVVEGLEAGRRLVVSGRRLAARLRLGRTPGALRLTSAASPEETADVAAGDVLTVVGAPADAEGAPGRRRWLLRDSAGFEGYMTDEADAFLYETPPGAATPADKHLLLAEPDGGEEARELVTLARAVASDAGHTKLVLTRPLGNFYARASVAVRANVARATHGEAVGEVLGGGDAARPYQTFGLRQTPLTYVAAETPGGADSTLEVRVNDLLWQEVPTLYGRGPGERVYVTRATEGGGRVVQFGDGREGARPPTGQENVTASYRKGLGRAGLVRAGQLSLLMTRPLGVKSVTNPLAATGAEDPQGADEIRAAAPTTVLTLGRVVSLRDYEDFARTFAGLDKAHAVCTWQAGARGVYVTVAGVGGDDVPEGGDLQTELVRALQAAGAPGVPVRVGSYRAAHFRLAAVVRVDPGHPAEKVRAAVEAALRGRFSFGARAFGQPVALSEVVAVMQSVEGVVAVDVRRLYRDGGARTRRLLNSLVTAELPAPGTGAARVLPAELLTLHPEPLGDSLTTEVGL